MVGTCIGIILLSFLSFVNYFFKSISISESQISQDFAIKFDFGFFQAIDEFGIRDFIRSQGGINSGNPKFSQVSFS